VPPGARHDAGTAQHGWRPVPWPDEAVERDADGPLEADPGEETILGAAAPLRTEHEVEQALADLEGAQPSRGLASELRHKLREALSDAAATTAEVSELRALLQSPAFRALGVRHQLQMLDVHHNADAEGRQALVRLAGRTLRVGPPPRRLAALLDVNHNGWSLLDGLHRIAVGSLDERFGLQGIQRPEILAAVLREAGQPGWINRPRRSTCVATRLHYMVCSQNPAEYVWILRGLLGPVGAGKLRSGYLLRVPESIAPDATGRTVSERLFQSAVTEFLNGPGPRGGGKELGVGGDGPTPCKGRVAASQVERGLAGLFGRNFQLHQRSATSARHLLELLARRSGLQTLGHLGRGGQGPQTVVFEALAQGRVYFRNPARPGQAQGGGGAGHSDSAPVRLEDPATGLQSLSFHDYVLHAVDLMVPV
jgi:hypothetical protein